MENQKLDRTTAEGLQKIQAGAKAATELMDRTHSLVRPSTLVWREIDLSTFLPMLKPAIDGFRTAKCNVVIDCPADLPHVYADMGRLKAALIELVRNACEATANGGSVRIEVRADDAPCHAPSAAVQPLKWVCITVIDDGPGIAPEMMEKVFAPFFSTKKKQSAAGLGLTVALGSVQQLGGVLRLKSEGRGTEVKILLPSRAEVCV
jgi:signal transduction histidine kinase